MALPVDPVLRHADAAAAQLAAQGDELARMAEASRLDVRIQRYRHGHSPPLLELLREPWDIVHIATHGDAAGQLLLPDNSLAVADDGAVRHGSAHGLVVINACWGVSVANPNTLADLYVKLGCAALVGPTLPVVSEAAALFSRVLYRRWFAGDALEIAVLAARTALAQSDLQPAWPLYVQYGGLGLTANGLAGV